MCIPTPFYNLATIVHDTKMQFKLQFHEKKIVSKCRDLILNFRNLIWPLDQRWLFFISSCTINVIHVLNFFEMLIIGAMKNSFWPQFFRLGKVDFPLKLGFYQYSYIIISFSSTQRSKTIFYIIFVAYDIIFSTKSEKDILTFVIFFSQFWTHTKRIST